MLLRHAASGLQSSVLGTIVSSIAFLLPGACHAQVPAFITDGEFHCKSFAEAVNHYVSLGETKAVSELKIATKDAKPLDLVARRVCFVLRLLFETKGHEPLEPPALGILNLPTESMPAMNWPYYPCVRVGKSLFLLGEDYCVSGVPIRATEYLDYCRDHGKFLRAKLPVPNRRQALADLQQLRRSKEWTAIRWTALSERRTYEYLMNQVTSVPD